ncbi:Kntc1 [Phodopus roborovskii]|uniref:Kntc1 protein n=1 Tax=Phodopus roborovskii TaxID=109678 RepID=A0AAV0A4Y5_PHORO|nr:Kntc1 [Phodopus roborovskii]
MWSNVELLTSDDTGSGHVNIGSKKENVTALYQVDLLGRISSEKASLSPKIQACSLSDGFIIVADQSVILLDSICRALQLHLIFDTDVDVVGLCHEGKFLLVGERSGNLHLIHVTSKQTLFTKRASDEYQHTYRNLIIEKGGSNEGTYYMLLLTNNGFFYITNLQLSQIEQAQIYTCILIFFFLILQLQGQFKCSFISTENYHSLGCLNLVVGEFASETPVIIGGTGSCAFSKWESDSTKKEISLKNFVDTEIIKGFQAWQMLLWSSNLINPDFGIVFENVLSLWDAYTLTPVWNWPSLPIEQFLLTTEADSPSSVTWQGIANLKLVTLTTTTKEKTRNLIIYSLPTMEILYSLEVSSVSSLVQTGISTDTIYLLEGIHKNDPNLSEDSVSDLVLKYLTEVLPENRLSRLLHKHRFAEAESFAIQFGLDVEVSIHLFKLFLGRLFLNILAKWLEQASRNLELTDKANWPENGLQLAEVFFIPEKTEKFGFASSWQWISWKDYQNTEEVQQLQTLVIKLQELITLHKKYNCKLSLSEFEKENTTTIVFRMFDRVSAPELIPSVLEKFVRVYMREQNLQEEELLLLYIEDLLKRCSSKSMTLFDTAWEAKAMAVIRCLSDTDLIFDAVLKIMYKAVVPWSAAVEQLVKQHLEMDHPKVKLLQESYKLMEMKKLLRGYGIREVNLLNKEIMRVVRYILKQDIPSSLEDALKVAQGYRLSDDEIYSLRIIDLIDREQEDDCLLLLRSLPPAEAEKTAERVIIWARLALQEEPDGSEEDKAWRMSVAKTSVDILKILCDIQKGNLQKKDESEEFLKRFKVVASLQENFEVFLPFEDYSNSTLVASLREQYIKAHEDAQAEHKLRGPPGPTLARGTDLSIKSKLHRQALALQVSAQELEAELALRALKDGKVGAALSKCRHLLNYYCNADTGKLLFLVCQKLCQMLANDVPMTAPVGLNLPSEIHDLACQAATICSPDLLLDALELSKYTLTAVELSRQCQMDDCGILMKHVVLHLICTVHINTRFTTYPCFGSPLGPCPLKSWGANSFSQVFNCRLVDLDLALAYCTLLPQKDVFENLWKLIDKAWQNYSKVLALSLVGSQLANLYQDVETGLRFHELSIDAQWGIRLGKLGISFEPAFRQGFVTKKDLLKALVNNIDMDTGLILEYCSTFQLDSDAALQLYIETLLHNTNNQSQGGASLEPTKQQHSRLLTKATEMVPLLANTKDLVFSLTEILYKLDPYDYEMIEVVLKVIEQANEKITSVNINQALNLLRHLKSYKRISPPVDLEYQYMLEHVITLPPTAQTRLPFHLILFGTAQNFWKILSSELSEESLPTLLLISKLMKFSLDTLYVSTAKHIFEKSLKPKLLKLAQAQSALMSKEVDKLTQTIESYLLSIVNPEWAVAIAISLTQEVPEGPFKMTSLKFCLYLAERWLQNIPSQDETREKAQALLKKLYLQFRRSGTEAVLIAHKLNVPEYLRMVGKPAHLIVSLYEHPSISERLRTTSGKDHPDIHAAAKEIAEVNEINLEKIWDMLLEKWLCPSTLLSETLGMRQITFAHKTRALQCLFYLADKEMIESLFKKPTEEMKSYLKCITFLASFETLNIPITYELFCNSPKEGMIKGLWKNHSHEPMAVRLVAELCLEYKIYDLQLWNGLLQKLLGFNMISYLRKVLSSISSVHSLWQVPYFSRAWQRVIQIPLLSASCPLRPSQLADCCESLIAILECPVSDDLDMMGVAKQYVQLELPAFALACLMLMPHSEKRHQQIKNFLDSCDAQIILQQLEEHMSTGQLAGFSHQIRSLILNHIINKKEFGILAKTKYFQLLKWHMINTNNITELVNYLANDLSLDEASALITEYSKHCGKPMPPDAAPCEILKVKLADYCFNSNMRPFI